MTVIQADIRDANNQPLTGYIQVTLEYQVLDSLENIAYVPTTKIVPLVAGVCTMTLEPSETSNVTYLFEVYQQITDSSVTPAVVTPFLVWDFRAKIPDSLTPIKFVDLQEQTGILHDTQDASILNIVRRIYLSDNFWQQVQQQLFPVKGAWTSTGFYRRGDVVSWQGGSFIYINSLASAGHEPNPLANTDWWFVFSKQGQPGVVAGGNDAPYSSVGWNGQTDAPSRNAVRDAIEGLVTQTEVDAKLDKTSGVLLGTPTLNTTPPTSDNTSRLTNTAWVQANLDIIRKALTPIGAVSWFAGSSAPSKWSLLDGRVLDRTTYADLFAVIGTSFNTGGETGTQFRLPDCRGRFLTAPDQMSAFMGSASRNSYNFGNGGGAQSQLISISQLPQHYHNLQSFAVSNTSAFTLNDSNGDFIAATDAAAPGTNGVMLPASRFNTTPTISGSSAPPEALLTMPPFLALNVIIYTGV